MDTVAIKYILSHTIHDNQLINHAIEPTIGHGYLRVIDASRAHEALLVSIYPASGDY